MADHEEGWTFLLHRLKTCVERTVGR
jgi:hypothetical protein